MQVEVYPDSLLDLLNPVGFEKQFWLLYRSQNWKSRKECFEALQDRHEQFFGFRKYSEYASFCNQISRRHTARKLTKG